MSNTADKSEDKVLTVYEFLLSNSKKNNIKCSECDRNTNGGHFYAIKFFDKDNKIYWKGKYKVGCTHVDWDGEEWCDSCYTIADDKILCSNCGCLSWGKPTNTKNRLYMWIDGSVSKAK